MARSIERANAIVKARKDRYKNKGLRPDKLDDNQFNVLLQRYYNAAANRGMYVTIEEAVENKGFYFLGMQRDIAECILASVFKREKRYIYISVPRQIGKTDIVVFTMSFCYEHYSSIFGEPLRVATIAPEKGTATEVFDRLHDFILLGETDLATDTKTRVETIRGDTIALYGLYEGGGAGATIEGRTHDVIIRDEGHMGDDAKFLDQVLPTTSRTRGPIIVIGNGGFRDCFFYRGILGGTNEAEKKYVFRYTWETLEDYMLDLASKGIISAQTWVDNTRAYIAACGGLNSLSVRKNVLCEWVLTIGSYLTEEDLTRCENRGDIEEIPQDIYVTVDVAVKGRDRTVAMIGDGDGYIFDMVVLKDVADQIALREQCDILAGYCEDMGYIANIRAIGVDATGLGVGMVEFMEVAFSAPIKSFIFSQVKKMDWYLALRDSIITTIDGDRLSFNKNHKHYPTLAKELIDLEVTVTKNGNLSFAAPASAVMGKAVNDDYVAALAMYRSLIGLTEGFYSNVKEFDDRLPEDAEEDARIAARLAEAPHSSFSHGPWGNPSASYASSPRISALRARRAAKNQGHRGFLRGPF